MKILNRNCKVIFFIIFSLFISSSLYSQSKIDTTRTKQQTIYKPTKSPASAMLRSAIIPGWGQFYNEAYWKIPVIWGFSAGFIYYWIQNNKQYNDYADKYASTQLQGYYELREFYRDQRDLNGVFLFLTYFLNIVDAYVDAQLFDFSTFFNPATRSSEIGFQYRF